MIPYLLYQLTDHLPCKIISEGDRQYLERYYLFTLGNVRFYIHRFVGSDPDRGLHNHPWKWALSLLLSGYYFEQNSYGLTRVLFINGLVGDSLHRVILPPDRKEVWTLFFHQHDRAKDWGFLREESETTSTYTKHVPNQKEADDWWLTAPKGKATPKRLAYAN